MLFIVIFDLLRSRRLGAIDLGISTKPPGMCSSRRGAQAIPTHLCASMSRSPPGRKRRKMGRTGMPMICVWQAHVCVNRARKRAQAHPATAEPRSAPEMFVSAIRHKFSQQQSSFTASMLNLREAPRVSDRKSNDQRSPDRMATGIGALDPRARLRPHRRLRPSFSRL